MLWPSHPLGKSPVPTAHKAGLAPQPVWTSWKTKISCRPIRKQAKLVY